MFTLSFLCVNYIQTNWPSAISPPIYHLVPIYPYMMGFQLFKDVLCNEPFFDNLGNETKTFKTFCLVFKRMIITTLIIQHFKVWGFLVLFQQPNLFGKEFLSLTLSFSCQEEKSRWSSSLSSSLYHSLFLYHPSLDLLILTHSLTMKCCGDLFGNEKMFHNLKHWPSDHCVHFSYLPIDALKLLILMGDLQNM